MSMKNQGVSARILFADQQRADIAPMERIVFQFSYNDLFRMLLKIWNLPQILFQEHSNLLLPFCRINTAYTNELFCQIHHFLINHNIPSPSQIEICPGTTKSF